MQSRHPDFSKFHNKIIGAIFYREFYRYIFKAKFKELIIFYILISAIAISIPMFRTYNILSTDENQVAVFTNEILQDFPELKVENSKLNHEPPITLKITHPTITYPVIAIDTGAESATAKPSKAAIIFLQDAIIINELRLIDIFLTQAKLMNIDDKHLGNNNSQYSLTYAESDYVIDAAFIHKIMANFTNFTGKSYIYLIIFFIIFNISTILMRALFFGAFIFFFGNNRNLNLKYTSAVKLALAALIPGICLSSLNIITLWQSNILNNPNIASLLFMAINLYFAIFAVQSLVKVKTK